MMLATINRKPFRWVLGLYASTDGACAPLAGRTRRWQAWVLACWVLVAGCRSHAVQTGEAGAQGVAQADTDPAVPEASAGDVSAEETLVADFETPPFPEVTWETGGIREGIRAYRDPGRAGLVGALAYKLVEDIENVQNQCVFLLKLPEAPGPDHRVLDFWMKIEGGASFQVWFYVGKRKYWMDGLGVPANPGSWEHYRIDFWNYTVKASSRARVNMSGVTAIQFRIFNAYSPRSTIYFDDMKFIPMPPLATDAASVTVKADQRSAQSFNPVWRDFSQWEIDSPYGPKNNPRLLQEIPVRQIRYHTHHWQRRIWPTPGRYDFEYVDNLFKTQLLREGSSLCLTWEYVPRWLMQNTRYANMTHKGERDIVNGERMYPRDARQYQKLIHDTVLHFKQEGMNVTHYEVLNEPFFHGSNSPLSHYWRDKKARIFDMYALIAQSVKRADPEAKVGGVANSPGLENLTRWAHKAKQPLDFVSWHFYHNRPERTVRQTRHYRNLLDRYPEFKNTELHLNEWSTEFRKPYRGFIDTPYQAAFMSEVYRLVQDVPLTYAHFWDSAAMAGLFNRRKVPYPSYHTVRMFNCLEKTPAKIITSGDGVHGIASVSKNQVISLLWWYEPRDYTIQATRTVTFLVDSLPFTAWDAEVYLVDREHSFWRIGEGHQELERVAAFSGTGSRFEQVFDTQLYSVRMVRICRKGFMPPVRLLRDTAPVPDGGVPKEGILP